MYELVGKAYSMGLQLFSKRKWKDDSFNETNVTSILRNAKEMLLAKFPFTKSPFQQSNTADVYYTPRQLAKRIKKTGEKVILHNNSRR